MPAAITSEPMPSPGMAAILYRFTRLSLPFVEDIGREALRHAKPFTNCEG
jgi:hypothetical protein